MEQRCISAERRANASTTVLQPLISGLHMLAPAHQMSSNPDDYSVIAALMLARVLLYLVNQTALGDMARLIFALFLNEIIISKC
jgi:hypothetical protein